MRQSTTFWMKIHKKFSPKSNLKWADRSANLSSKLWMTLLAPYRLTNLYRAEREHEQQKTYWLHVHPHKTPSVTRDSWSTSVRRIYIQVSISDNIFFFSFKNRIFPFLVFLMFWLILSRRTQIYGISFNLRITQIVAGMH